MQSPESESRFGDAMMTLSIRALACAAVLNFGFLAGTQVLLASSLADIVKEVRPALVRIEGRNAKNLGSGVVVHSNGIIATSFHVIGDADKGTVIFEDGRRADILGLVAEKKDHDIVLLKISSVGDLVILPICEALPEKGEEVYAFGNSGGARLAVTRGAVIATAKTADIGLSGQQGSAEQVVPYSADATWVKTNATISIDNSGGPLINAKGQVVGINSWCESSERDLNVAGSALIIADILRTVTDEVTPLRSLRPQSRPPMVANDTGRIRIDLPGNKSIDFSIFFSNVGEIASQDRVRAQSMGAFNIDYPSGKPFAILPQRSGKLHGTALAQHENGQVMLMAGYESNERSGNCVTLTDQGVPLFAAQYNRGNKEGFGCLFEAGAPWLIQEHSKNRLMRSHLCMGSSVVESIDHRAPEPVEGSQAMELAFEELAALEKKMKTNEQQIKKLVKELEDDIRKQRAAVRGAYSQQMIQQRINARAAENAAIINGLRQASGLGGF